MDFYNRSMEKLWKIHGQPMYSKQYALCMRPTFSILMENPSFLHGVHVFSMEFHDFSMGKPWYIFVREKQNTPNMKSCSFVKHDPVFIIFGLHSQNTFKITSVRYLLLL